MYLIGVAAARIALILLRSQLRADLRRPCSELGRKRGGGKRWNRRPLLIVRKLATPGLKAPIGTLLPGVEQDEQRCSSEHEQCNSCDRKQLLHVCGRVAFQEGANEHPNAAPNR